LCHGLTLGRKEHIIIPTDPSTPLSDAHHGRTFLLGVKHRHMGEEKMKTLVIYGSERHGSTYHLTKNFLTELNSEVTEFFLPKALDHHCLSCHRCMEGEDNCPFYSEKQPIMLAMEEADILVFSSPTYCMAPTGAMMDLLDLFFTNWLVHQPKPCFFTKKAVIISTCAGKGAKNCTKIIKSSLGGWGISEIYEKPYAVYAREYNGIKEETVRKINRDLAVLAHKLNQNKKAKVTFKTKMFFNLMVMMHKKDVGASPYERAYFEKNGWFDKKKPWRAEPSKTDEN